MNKIFISYSRKDAQAAISLAERLRGYGASVWMDTASLAAAQTWSAEIVTAIEECSIFIILLSHDSVSSDNVTKELSLASECKKRIVPIELHPTELNQAMKYALAGVQKVSIHDEEALSRAFDKLSIPFQKEEGKAIPKQIPATNKPQRSALLRFGIPLLILLALGAGSYVMFSRTTQHASSAVETRVSMQTVAVLPFESMNLSKEDNSFADGLMSDVISILGKCEDVQVTDRKTAMSYKGRSSDVRAIGKELDVKYIVDGTFQKQGKNVKINIQLISTETAKSVFSESYEGTTDDIITLQEKLARSIAFELQISLAKRTTFKSDFKRGTNNTEAYELFIAGIAAIEGLSSRTDVLHAEELLEQATIIDPNFIHPYYYRALGHINLYHGLGERFGMPSNNPNDIAIADSLVKVMDRFKPDFPDTYLLKAELAVVRDSIDLAITYLTRYIRVAPEQSSTYFQLGSLYYVKRDFVNTSVYLEKAVQRNFADLKSYSVLISALDAIGDRQKVRKYVDISMPLYERVIEKRPMKVNMRSDLALNLTHVSEYHEKARKLITFAINLPNADGSVFYTAACVYARLNDERKAIEMLKRSLLKGYSFGAEIATDPDLMPIKNTPEFKALLAEVGGKK